MRFAHYFGAPRFISILGENSLGSTPLLCAVMSQNSRAIKELLRARADASATNARGRGALALADMCGSSWELLISEATFTTQCDMSATPSARLGLQLSIVASA
mmetsp:Transcript_69687/g.195370  ORF Transcript_69687/g.195370 Transcript_69687/m.195370 type:complete len:103 (+) Transcript_69687:2-310(+)